MEKIEVENFWKSNLRKVFIREKKGLFGKSVEMACTSHTGRLRCHNEDNFYFDGIWQPMEHQSLNKILCCRKSLNTCPVVAVFDGMGGECAGELASFVAAGNFEKHLPEKWSEESLTELTRNLDREVSETTKREKIGLSGSTEVILALEEKKAWICNLGDSPAYRIRAEKLERISQAHTNEAFLRRQGIKNRKPGLTQFLGVGESDFMVEPFVKGMELQKGDVFLLCSDGLTDMVPEVEIQKVLVKETALEKQVQELLDCALKAGGRDNVTMILCRVTA